MELLSVNALYGPNIWGKAGMLEARVDVSAWQHLSTENVIAFQQRLAVLLPDWSSRPTPAQRGLPGIALAEALRDVALALQTLVSVPVTSGGIGPISSSATLAIAVEYDEERLARACLDSARRICLAALTPADLDVAAELRRLRVLAEDVCLGRATSPLVAAARPGHPVSSPRR